jgi:hypothetical protein
MPLLILDITVPAFTLLLGIYLLYLALRHYRFKPAPICLQCRYDMRATPGLTCPDCGFTHTSQNQILKGQIFKRSLLFGTLLTILGLLPPIGLAIEFHRNRQSTHFHNRIRQSITPDFRTQDRPFTTTPHTFLVRLIASSKFKSKGHILDYEIDHWLFYNKPTKEYFSPPFIGAYLSSLFLSPMHHYGRRFPYYAITEVSSRNVNPLPPPSPPPVPLTSAQYDTMLQMLAQDEHIWVLGAGPDQPLTDRHLASIMQIKNLDCLGLDNIRVESKSLPPFRPSPRFRVISLRLLGEVDDAYLAPIASIPTLDYIVLSSPPPSRITPASLTFSNAGVLMLDVPTYVADDPAPFKHLSPKARIIGLRLPDIQPSQLATLSRSPPHPFPHLHLYLDFTGNPFLDDDSLRFLAKYPIPGNLRLTAGKNMTLQSVSRLFEDARSLTPPDKMPSHLMLSGFPLTPDELQIISQPNLADLALYNTRLDEKSARILANSKKLVNLYLYDTDVTPSAWDQLASSTTLRTIGVSKLDDTILAHFNTTVRLHVSTKEDNTSAAAKAQASGVTVQLVNSFGFAWR